MSDRNHGVNDFLAKFKNGIAKPNRYRVEFGMPQGVRMPTEWSVGDIFSGGQFSDMAQGALGGNPFALFSEIPRLGSVLNANGSIDIKCHTMTMPQRSLMTYEHKQNSAPVRFPYSSTYDPVTFSFYADTQYDTRQFFEVWQSAVMNFGTNTVNFYDEYKSDIHMYTLDDYGNDAYKVTLFDAYPLNIGIVDLSYSQANNYQSVTVTMSYRHWLSSKNKDRELE